MTEILTPDICVIGAGAGGLSVAAGAARLGVSVVVIEKGEMGGDCLNAGCVPSKTLIASAHAAQAMRDAARFGVHAVEPRVEWAAVRERIKATIAAIAPNDSAGRYAAMGVRVIRAAARFVDARTVEAGGLAIRARRFVLATGSSPFVPPIQGLEFVRYLTNETIFDIETLPRRLIVIGGGAQGVELAQAFRRLGSEAIIIEADRALAREDPELAAVALDRLRREGVDLREGRAIARIEPRPEGVRVVLGGQEVEETIDGTHLLIATGRKPNVDNLGLEAAGVKFDRAGVKTRSALRTSNRRVYAVGDVTGVAQLTAAANYHAGLVLRQILFRLPARARQENVPRVTYTDPEIAWVGLSEDEARARHRKLRVLRWSLAENDRAQAEGAAHGHIKVVTARDGRALGCGIVGRAAGELIAPWSLAISKGLMAQDVANAIFAYPTLSEVSRRAALGVYADKLDSAWLQSVLRFLRKFG
ncbi:MAG: FAD-dependent oxidoreductase [Rhodoblastus sp.]|nr:FAD-dependent oxidoreductase [Rhodoblastus sp.]